MAQENWQKYKLLKLLELLRQETDEQHPLATSALCNRLAEMGISCERRTLTKDIAVLNDLGYEVMWNWVGKEKGYYIEDRSFSVPELKILIDAVQAASFITDKKTAELIDKIAELGGTHKADILKSNMVCFNTRKHSNESIYYNVGFLEDAIQQQKGVAECDCTRLKDSALREQFIAAYNQFVRERPQGHDTAALQSVVAELRKEESDLAELLMQRLITESAFRAEQRRIKAQIEELTTKINEQRGKIVRESDFTIITEFAPEKVEKFITKVIVRRWTVTFVFYNGVEITRAYTNGPSGNQVGWKQKKEVAAWQ